MTKEICSKAAEIAVIQNEQVHIKKSLAKIETIVEKIDKDVNNGINTTMAALAERVTKHGGEIDVLDDKFVNHLHRDYESLDRDGDSKESEKVKVKFKDKSRAKQVAIILPILVFLKVTPSDIALLFTAMYDACITFLGIK